MPQLLHTLHRVNMGRRQIVRILVLWCVLVGHIFEFAHARASDSTTTTPCLTPDTPTLIRATPSVDCSTSRSGSEVVPETPTETVEAESSTAAPTASSNDTAYVCCGDDLARLMKLNENNLYLQSQCITLAGLSSYVFPFHGELSYAQIVAMSVVDECEYYFRAVLLVQLQECVDANVYIRTTAETILQLVCTSGNAPTEVEVNEAIAVRKTYNLALRDGDGAAMDAATSEASALSWNIEGDTLDTTVSANTTGQLLLSTDLRVIGTYYASLNASTSVTSKVQDARPPGQSTDISEACRKKRGLPWLVVAVTCACITLLLH